MMAEFDAYLMVDWSASSTPKTGKDSIWYCLLARREGLDELECSNPATRHDAYERVREILVGNAAQRLRTLVGFDFPYGYPAGFTRLAGLASGPPWRVVWDELHGSIADDRRNGNNRGQVAAKLNDKISGDSFPFWGNGLKDEIPNLCKRKTHCSNERYASFGLKEKRIAEERCTAQAAWKLSGAGSVGGQALLGMLYLKKLRDDRSSRLCLVCGRSRQGSIFRLVPPGRAR